MSAHPNFGTILPTLEARRLQHGTQWLTHTHTHITLRKTQTASNEKLMKYLPDFEFTPFEVALQESVDWFIQVRRAANSFHPNKRIN